MTKGHNSVDPGRLKSLIRRIEKLNEERDSISNDIREVYSEAKSAGYTIAILRELIRERKLDAADRAEREELLRLYRDAVGA